MVTEIDILTAVNQLLTAKYPSVAVYVNLCPKNFLRPSFFIEHVATSSQDKSCKLIEQTVHFTITCFLETDSHYNVDAESLMVRQTEVVSLFRKGYITVGDRAVKVKECTSGFKDMEAYVGLQFEYCDDRSAETDDTALMKTITTNLNLKEE